MEPRLIEKYRVGGDIKTLGAHETRWQFGNHEIRVRIRRGNWQYFVSAGARVTAEYEPKMFPEFLDIRCPTMSEGDLNRVKDWAQSLDERPVRVSTERFMPRKGQYNWGSSRYIRADAPGTPERVQSWTE